MSMIEVYCPLCLQWRVEDIPEEEITAATINGNSLASFCSKQCREEQDRVDRITEEFYGLR